MGDGGSFCQLPEVGVEAQDHSDTYTPTTDDDKSSQLPSSSFKSSSDEQDEPRQPEVPEPSAVHENPRGCGEHGENLEEVNNNDNNQATSRPSSARPTVQHHPRPRKPNRRQKQGTFIQGWEFSFETLSKLNKTVGDRQLPKDRQESAKSTNKKPIKKINRAKKTSTTEENNATKKRTKGGVDTQRVEQLLRKYLGDKATDTLMLNNHDKNNQSDGVSEEGDAAGVPLVVQHRTNPTTLAKYKTKMNTIPAIYNKKSPVKSIMQVKSEQDQAIKALKSAPKEFHAKPIPMSTVIKPVDGTDNGAIRTNISNTTSPNKYTSESQDAPSCTSSSMSFSNPVPVSSTEPRYAMLVADNLLRKYSDLIARDGNDDGICQMESSPWLPRPQSAIEPGAFFLGRRQSSPRTTQSILPDIVEE